jgi:hypothetical protein
MVLCNGKLFDNGKDFAGDTLASEAFVCDHNVNLALVLFDPLGKEQIYITDHLLLGKD